MKIFLLMSILVLLFQLPAWADSISGGSGEYLSVNVDAAKREAADRIKQKRAGGDVNWICSKAAHSGTACDEEVKQRFEKLGCDIAYHTENVDIKLKKMQGPDCTPYGVGSYPDSGFSCSFYSQRCRSPGLYDPCAFFEDPIVSEKIGPLAKNEVCRAKSIGSSPAGFGQGKLKAPPAR